MKKLYKNILVISTMGICLMIWAMPAKTQTVYDTIYMDVQPSGNHIPHCATNSDTTIYVAPTGADVDDWFAEGEIITYRGDSTLIAMPSSYGIGINGQRIDCYYNGNIDYWIKVHAVNSLTSAGFPATDTVCGTGVLTLDLLNGSTYQTTFNWWKDGTLQPEHTQTFTTSVGIIIGESTNACGTVSNTVTIIEYNPNPPVLNDTVVCLGVPVILNPGIYDLYLWTGGSDNPTLSPTVSGTYSVTVTDNNYGCTSTTSAIVTFLTPPNQEIKLVTIDTNNGNNRITWDILHSNAETINIYRELTTNNYQLVGSVPYTAGSFTDTVNSRNQAWRYKIAIVDTCSNEGDKSPYVQSIHSWVTPNIPSGYTVQWTPYLIESKDAVSQYNIYHGPQLAQLSYLTFVSGTVTVYTLSSFLDSVYVIGAQLGAKGAYDDALSNWVSENDAVGISENETNSFDLFPNPVSDLLQIQTTETITTIEIMDATGRLLIATNQHSIDCSALAKGMYIIRLISEKGEYKTKFVVSR